MAVQRRDAAKTRALDILGINEQEERAYRWLLDHSGASVAEISRALSLSPNKTQRLLDAIETKGLTTHSPHRPRRYIPAPPDIALKALSLRHQEGLQRAEGVIQELQERAAARRQGEREPMVELIAGREALRQVFDQMNRTARHEILGLVRPPVLVSRLDTPIGRDHYEQIRAQARGVRYRTVVDTEFLALPFAVNRIRENKQSGEDTRIMPRLPFKMVLSDHRFAIIPLDLRQPEGPTLLVRSGGLLNALYALFEFFWERAAPISFTHANEIKIGNHRNRISDEAEKLLSLLSTGMNDKSIVYELGISRSTYSRRVAEIMKALNAATRFQLGWLAKEYMSAKTPGR